MKKLSHQSRTVLFVIIGATLALFSVAFGPSAAITQSITPTPMPSPTAIDIGLDIGSTDGILIWAFLIALIIFIPILLNWSLGTKKKG